MPGVRRSKHMDTAMANSEPTTSVSTWRLSRFLPVFAIALVAQGVFLPCLCTIGTAKIKMALILDALIWLRVAAAWIRREERGGTFYAALWITSPLWIELAFWIAGVHH